MSDFLVGLDYRFLLILSTSTDLKRILVFISSQVAGTACFFFAAAVSSDSTDRKVCFERIKIPSGGASKVVDRAGGSYRSHWLARRCFFK